MQKFLWVLLLGLLVCSNAFADEFKPVTKEDNVSLFGVVLGDNIKNYELTKHGCSVWAIRDVKECQIVPKIKNKSFTMDKGVFVYIYPHSEEIYSVHSFFRKQSAYKYYSELSFCTRYFTSPVDVIAESKEKNGFKIKDKNKSHITRDTVNNNPRAIYTLKMVNKNNKFITIWSECTKYAAVPGYSLRVELSSYSQERNKKEFYNYKKTIIDKEGL
uniref:Uncharacterized protein n=1 Tax=uncultured marine microorganism HF4000_097M14 TaxID=455520 RepID=B3T1V9_9ZZZZ|nr:hypothetical protein ALOHA_HF4000097M14ctg1g11 [uncultured marine microorganism HF4000_097M14]